MSSVQLAILSLAMVFEPRKGTDKPPLSKQAKFLESDARKIKRMVHKTEKRCGIHNLSKRCYFHLTPAIEAWIKGESFDEILDCVAADEGELVRFFRMSIQVLREVAETPVSEELKKKMAEVIRRINRDVIDSEKQLRS